MNHIYFFSKHFGRVTYFVDFRLHYWLYYLLCDFCSIKNVLLLKIPRKFNERMKNAFYQVWQKSSCKRRSKESRIVATKMKGIIYFQKQLPKLHLSYYWAEWELSFLEKVWFRLKLVSDSTHDFAVRIL